MKILFLTPYLPGPPVFGGQRRIHGLMAALAESNEVSIVSLVDASTDQAGGLRDAERFCQHIVTVPDRRHRVSGRTKRLLQLRSMVSRRSWEQSLYHRPAFQAALDRHLEEHHYDVVNCEFVFMGGYRFRFGRTNARKTRLFLDEHNVEYDILRRTASATRFDRKVFNALNYRKLKREETAMWARFDGCTLTSTRDEQIVRREVPSARTAVIPNGVDIDAFRPQPSDHSAPMTLLFFGAINYFPNTDGVLFFLKEVFPILAARYPLLRIRIVGPGAPDEVVALANTRVEIVGFVDDLRSEIARAAVVLAPLRIGGGTRLKILEAMAVARPIVSTSIGAEGLDVKHERDILLADTPDGLAREVGRVLEDAALSARLGRAARQTAEAHYSWRAAAKKLEAFYGAMLA
jgi:glycosyltransferase involved in cell wall biosynthesis